MSQSVPSSPTVQAPRTENLPANIHAPMYTRTVDGTRRGVRHELARGSGSPPDGLNSIYNPYALAQDLSPGSRYWRTCLGTFANARRMITTYAGGYVGTT